MATYTVHCDGYTYQIIGPDVTGREVIDWRTLASKLSGDARTKARGKPLWDACFALGELVYAVGREQGKVVAVGHDSGKHTVEDDGRIAAAIAACRAAYAATSQAEPVGFTCQTCSAKVTRQGWQCARCYANE